MFLPKTRLPEEHFRPGGYGLRVQPEAAHEGLGSVFDIVTRTAVAGVRGTRFRVATTDGSVTRVETLQGKVELGAPKGKVDVAAGQGSQVDESGLPEPARKLLPAATVEEPTHGSVAPGTQLTWRAVPGAATYRLEVARDAEFSTQTQQIRCNDARWPITGLDASRRWFWRVAAVDSAGFTGMTSKVYAFQLSAQP